MKFQLGHRLIENHLISEDQLQLCLSQKTHHSGKIGTHLVELGFLSLLDLEKNLGEVFGLPVAQDRDLEHLDYFCKKQFPLTVLTALQALPFRRTEHRIMIAITRKEAADEVRRVFGQMTQLPVDLFVISEIKFHYYLFRHFQKDLDPRIRRIYFQYKLDFMRQEHRQQETLNDGEPHDIFDLAVEMVEEPKISAHLSATPLAEHEELTDANDDSWYEMYLNPKALTPPSATPQIIPTAHNQLESVVEGTLSEAGQFEPEFASLE